METKRDGVGTLFNHYVSSKTRLVDTDDLATVNAPKKRGRKRKILTDQELIEKKERRRCQNQKAAQTLRNKRERQMTELKEQVETLTKQKGDLEHMVQQLLEEKQSYLSQLKVTPTTVPSKQKVATTTKSVTALESAELVDLPSGATYGPSQLFASLLMLWCVIQFVCQRLSSAPSQYSSRKPHQSSLVVTPSSLRSLNRHYWTPLLTFPTLSRAPHLRLRTTPISFLPPTKTCGERTKFGCNHEYSFANSVCVAV